MTLKQYLILMSISTVFCWIIWVLVLYLVDPTEASLFGFVLFYLSLFSALAGTLSVVGLLLRMRLGKEEAVFRLAAVSFRQSTMISLLFIGSLFLKSKALLTWWNIIFLILALVILEFFFISYNRK